jgi:hypothetical protein
MQVTTGTCFALFAYEVGFSIDLVAAEERITAARETLRQKRRAPKYLNYHPSPLRVTQHGGAVAVGRWSTGEQVDIVLYDFGAVSVTYRIALDGPLAELVTLSETLNDRDTLANDSLRRVQEVAAAIHPAIAKPSIADIVETYTIFEIGGFAPACTPFDLRSVHAPAIAQILRSERAQLSADEVADALNIHIAYGIDDVTIIDWDATFLSGNGFDDVRAVLEFANVELLEMRYLDQRLDDALDEAYRSLSRRAWRGLSFSGVGRADLRRVAELQADSAVLFEGVNNALKLLGDQYLARVYRLVSQRFHLAEWDASILRKIGVLESIYEKLADAASTRRLEILEWIIIILIALSIAIAFVVPGASH